MVRAVNKDLLTTLRRLWSEATQSEWKTHADESVKWDDPMACGYDSRAPDRGRPYYCTGPRADTVEQAEADSALIVALHNAFPELAAAADDAERFRRLLLEATAKETYIDNGDICGGHYCHWCDAGRVSEEENGVWRDVVPHEVGCVYVRARAALEAK